MIILYKPQKSNPFTWYWACEYCGGSQDSGAPAGRVAHMHDCRDKTWEKRLSQPRFVMPAVICWITFFVCSLTGWVLPEYYWYRELHSARKVTHTKPLP